MEIKDLNQHDQSVLVALYHKIILSDRQATPEELQHLDALVTELGEENYNTLVAQIDEKWGDSRTATEAFLLSVEKQEARDLIYGAILEVALEDGIDGGENELLEWLKENWYIKVEFLGE